MPTPDDALKGVLMTQLGIPTSGLQQTQDLLVGWARAWTLNGTTSAANSLLKHGMNGSTLSNTKRTPCLEAWMEHSRAHPSTLLRVLRRDRYRAVSLTSAAKECFWQSLRATIRLTHPMSNSLEE